jgi:hypothetical protein
MMPSSRAQNGGDDAGGSAQSQARLKQKRNKGKE